MAATSEKLIPSKELNLAELICINLSNKQCDKELLKDQAKQYLSNNKNRGNTVSIHLIDNKKLYRLDEDFKTIEEWNWDERFIPTDDNENDQEIISKLKL